MYIIASEEETMKNIDDLTLKDIPADFERKPANKLITLFSIPTERAEDNNVSGMALQKFVDKAVNALKRDDNKLFTTYYVDFGWDDEDNQPYNTLVLHEIANEAETDEHYLERYKKHVEMLQERAEYYNKRLREILG